MKSSKRKLSSIRKQRKHFRKIIQALVRKTRKQRGGSVIQLSPGRSTSRVVKFTRSYF